MLTLRCSEFICHDPSTNILVLKDGAILRIHGQLMDEYQSKIDRLYCYSLTCLELSIHNFIKKPK